MKRNLTSRLLLWVYPILLILPNIGLSLGSEFTFLPFAANIALPFGVYMLLLASTARPGRSATLMLPFSILAAFQIVLIFLYEDGSPIAVDMFLNCVTTNSSEAGELLGNLIGPVMLVVCLYLPPLVVGIVDWIRKEKIGFCTRRHALVAGGICSAVGLVSVLCSYAFVPHYRVDYDVFPINVVCNLVEAVNRTNRTAGYLRTSADFTYGASSTRCPSEREVYVAVVGETSRADHYQLLGYNRFTTPRLCEKKNLIAYSRVMSESNTTHKSVPMLLSTIEARQYNDSIYGFKSFITAFKEAGFHTAFLSLQGRNGSFIEYFGNEADTVMFLRESEPGVLVDSIYDTDVIPVIRRMLADSSMPAKQLIVVHLYGSHFNYVDRYNRRDAFFLPDKTSDARAENRETLINAYDNSIRKTDETLSGIVDMLDSLDCQSGMIYASDHGEDIFDDERGRFLHASPTATFTQLHVPMILYFNDSWRSANPEKWRAASSAENEEISSSESFSHTLLHMAGIASPRLRPESALTSRRFMPVKARVFLNDRNEAVNLYRAGFSPADFDAMRRHHIRANY